MPSALPVLLLVFASLAGAVGEVPVERDRSEPYALISQVDASTWTVDEALVDVYTRDLRAAGVLAHATPHRDAEGRVDGFVLLEVVAGSPLHQAGFRPGDVVHSVDGRDIAGPFRALRVMRELKGAAEVQVRITREGETLDQHYQVVRD